MEFYLWQKKKKKEFEKTIFRVFLSRVEHMLQSSSDTSIMHDGLVVGLYGGMLCFPGCQPPDGGSIFQM